MQLLIFTLVQLHKLNQLMLTFSCKLTNEIYLIHNSHLHTGMGSIRRDKRLSSVHEDIQEGREIE